MYFDNAFTNGVQCKQNENHRCTCYMYNIQDQRSILPRDISIVDILNVRNDKNVFQFVISWNEITTFHNVK